MRVITDKRSIIYGIILWLIGTIAVVPAVAAASIHPTGSDTIAVTKYHNDKTSIWSAKLRGGDVDVEKMTVGRRAHSPTWSPDGRQLAYIGDDRLYIMDKHGNSRRLLTHAKGAKESTPTWSADGSRIAFVRTAANNDNRSAVYTVKTNGRGETNVSGWSDEYSYRTPSWSPKGDKLVYEKYSDAHAYLLIKTLPTGNVSVLTERSDTIESSDVSWSPNGKKILYKDSSSETYTIWPDGSHRAVISDGDSYYASWSGSGDRIIFIEDPKDDFVSVSEKDGTVVWLPIQKGNYDTLAHPTWSPDEDKIAFTMTKNDGGSQQSDLFVLDLDSETARPKQVMKNVTGRAAWRK